MSRVIGLLFTVVLLASLTGGAWAHSDGEGKLIRLPVGAKIIEVNGETEEIDVPAQIVDGRTLVPMGIISRSVGAKVEWDQAEKRATVVLGDRKVVVWIDRTEAEVDGVRKTLDVAPQLLDSRTMVPVRFMTENLGMVVGWDEDSRAVYLVSGHVDNVVLIKNYQYGTGSVTAKVGVPLVYINLDSHPHTVTAEGLAFDSGTLREGWAYTLSMKEPGSYAVYCDLHSSMETTLIIEP